MISDIFTNINDRDMDANSREKSIYKVTWIGSIVNFLLLVFKFIAGILGHSSALVADAVHSLSDFITDIVVILFVMYVYPLLYPLSLDC